MNRWACIVLSFVVCAHAYHSSEDSYEPEILEKCKEFSGVEFFNISRHRHLSFDSRNSSCFLACLDFEAPSSFPMWNENGTIIVENVIKWVTVEYVPEMNASDIEAGLDEQIIEAAETCADMEGSDFCDTVHKTQRCMETIAADAVEIPPEEFIETLETTKDE